MAYWDIEAHIGGVDYHYVPDVEDQPQPVREEERVRSQHEESAYRRYHEADFPLLTQACVTCHEMIWSDQGRVFVKGAYWNEEEDMFMDAYHDDCYKGDLKKIEIQVKRTSKLELEM